jgi:UDP-N-acetylglucosamine 2-epimerase (non-hydrolysing)
MPGQPAVEVRVNLRNSATLPDKSVVVILGTRPEIIKLGHIIRLLGPAASIVHTGQHFDVGLSQVFMEAFQLPLPDAELGVGGATRGAQIGHTVTELDGFLRANSPAVVVVQGDTNSAAAGALAANACEIPLVHVESGLRSFDRRMPEEHNRVVADHLADLCCAPTQVNRLNLRNERIPENRIIVTGNTIVEAVNSLLPLPDRRAALVSEYGLRRGEFILSTFHRPENVDDPGTLRTIIDQLAHLPMPVVFPVHPRTAARIEDNAVLADLVAHVVVAEPLGYESFLGLAAESAMLITDSGGVQEEASILKRPVLVVRRSTERPEVLGTFAERVEPGPEITAVATRWLGGLAELHARLADLPTPYGDGTASEKTVAGIATLVAASRF